MSSNVTNRPSKESDRDQLRRSLQRFHLTGRMREPLESPPEGARPLLLADLAKSEDLRHDFPLYLPDGNDVGDAAVPLVPLLDRAFTEAAFDGDARILIDNRRRLYGQHPVRGR